MFRLSALALLAASALCAQQAAFMDGLNATAWMQTSVEYRASALQAWRSARLSLPRALKDRRWTAALEQSGNFGRLPPAIIVDIDETVLDNSPAQARFLLHGNGAFSRQIWTQWTSEHRAHPVSGAREFLQEAAARGVTVFYLTNRGASEAADTRANLLDQSFPVKDTTVPSIGDSILLLGEQPAWTSDKTTRRAAVASHYRVLFLCGDDLNDFFSARLPLAARHEKARPHEAWWGERWIILPNPMYGSWEDALSSFDRALPPAAVQERKLKSLRTE